MSQIDSQKQAMYSRLYSIESDISQASSAISQARSNIASLDSAVGSLPGRLTAVRGRGYPDHPVLNAFASPRCITFLG